MKVLTGKEKVYVLGGAVALIITLCVVCYAWGKSTARATADSEYLRDRAVREKQIAAYEAQAAQHAENEKQLAAENALLRKQNEFQATILKANDAKLTGDAAKLDTLFAERNKKIESVNADENFLSLRLGLCNDVKAAGFPLSDAFCEGKQAIQPK